MKKLILVLIIAASTSFISGCCSTGCAGYTANSNCGCSSCWY